MKNKNRILKINLWLVFLLACFFINATVLSGQNTECETTVYAGEDIVLCEPVGTIDLIGEVTSDYIIDRIEWLGPNVANPNSLITTANPGGTATYILRAKILSPNLIFNGDFEQGNVGFTTDYVVPTPPYSPSGPLGPEGTYMISTNPSLTHTGFASCGDHTTGNGNMMVINGDPLPNRRVWCQIVEVDPSSDYQFSTWATSVISSNPARLQFSIDGVQLGSDFTLSTTTCKWEEFYEVWTSAGGSNPYNVEICIVNQNTATSGNDFAIDDIYFGRVCEVEDEMVVTELPRSEFTLDTLLCFDESLVIHSETFTGEGTHGPIILQAVNGCDSLLSVDIHYISLLPVIDNPQFLTCDVEMVTLSAMNSIIMPSGLNVNNIVYTWTTDFGNIVSGQGTPEIVVDQPGVYYLTMIYEYGGITCISEQVAVEVFQNINTPEVEIAVIQDDCSLPEWTLIGMPSAGTYEYAWSTSNGYIEGAYNTSTIVALSTGEYTLLIRDYINGCIGTASVTLVLNQLNVHLEGDLYIDCENPETTIRAVGGSPEYEYEWSTENGNIKGSTTEENITVDEAGTYRLKVIADDCEDILEVDVISLIENISIVLPASDTITCVSPQLQIIAEISGSNDYQTEWTTTDGSIDGSAASDTIMIKSAGTYYVTITTAGACTASDSIVIYADTDLPEFQLTATDSLNCVNLTTEIKATGLDGQENLIFSWTSTNGTIDSIAEDFLWIIAGEQGNFSLEVHDTISGCVYNASVEVFSDFSVLEVGAGAPDTLTCEQFSLQLEANVDSLHLIGSIYWYSNDGNISSGEESLNPIITSPGTYHIIVSHALSHCTSTDSVQIFIDDDKPVIIPSGNLELNCNNPTLIIDKIGSTDTDNTEHSWETQQGGNILSGEDSYQVEIDRAGIYIFGIKDNITGCESFDTIRVTENFEEPDVQLTNPENITCSRNSVEITVIGTENYYTYTWSTADGNIISDLASANVSVDAAGTYTVTITNEENGCVKILETEVEIDTTKPIIIVDDEFQLTCSIRTLTIEAEVQASGPTEIQWTSIDGNITGSTDETDIQIDAPGTYTITVTNLSNGCYTSVDVLVTEYINIPVLVTGPDLVITCRDPIVTAHLTQVEDNSDIFWYYEAGNIIATNVDSLEVSDAGILIIEVIDENGCISRDSIQITEDKEVEEVSAGMDQYIGCGRESIQVEAQMTNSAGYTFVWKDQSGAVLSQEQGITIDEAGIYIVTALNTLNGCESSDEVRIMRTENISFMYEVSLPLCKGEEGSFILKSVDGGLPEYNIRLDGRTVSMGENVQLNPGNYVLRIEDALGCIIEEDFVVEDANELILLYPSLINLSYGDNAHIMPLEAPDNEDIAVIEWFPDRFLSCSDCLNPIATPTESINYTVRLTDRNGCLVETMVQLRVDTEIKYYIPNAFTPNSDGINDRFWPRIGKGVKGITSIEVFNRWGDRVYQIKAPGVADEYLGWDGTYRGKNLEPAVYIYKVQLELVNGKIRGETGTLTLIR